MEIKRYANAKGGKKKGGEIKMALASQELAILSSPREKAAAGIDPARYSIQIALLSPSKEHYNITFPVCANTVEELENIVPKDIHVVAEGFGTTSRIFFLDLSQKGYTLWELNPALGKHLRILEKEAHTDSLDARSIARAGLYFPNRLSPICLKEEREALTSLLRMRKEIVKELTADWNRLHALLSESYGHWYDKLKKKVHTKKGRAFFKKYPSINAFCQDKGKEESFSPSLTQEEKEGLLSQKPWASKIYLESLEWQIRFLLEKIELLEGKKRELGKKIEQYLKEDAEAQLLQSIPGVGPVSAATLLSEIKEIERFPNEGKLAAYCGLVPCLRESGKMKARGAKRKYYNRKLKGTFFNIAFTAIRVNPIARSYYEKKRREGKTHRKALLCLARQYVKIVYAVLRKKQKFN